MKPRCIFSPPWLYLIFVLCLFPAQSYCKDGKIRSPEHIPGSTRVDAESLIEIAGSNQALVIIDSRISDDRHQGYIEGSISLPDENTDCDTLAIHLQTRNTPVLFYCNGPKCGRSARAVKIALSCGYDTIYWFRGGIEEWKSGNYPFIKE